MRKSTPTPNWKLESLIKINDDKLFGNYLHELLHNFTYPVKSSEFSESWLCDRASRRASLLCANGWNLEEISALMGVPVSAVYFGIELYRKYENELIAGVRTSQSQTKGII